MSSHITPNVCSELTKPVLLFSNSPAPSCELPAVDVAHPVEVDHPEFSQVTNEEFIKIVFPSVPNGASVMVCSKSGDPSVGGWPAVPADLLAKPLMRSENNYVNCGSFGRDPVGTYNAKKENFEATHFIMLDDIGTKVPWAKLGDAVVSWAIETSPGNHQVGLRLDPPVSDKDLLARLLSSIIEAGLCDPGSTGASTRWARLPVGVNGKVKYQTVEGRPFSCRVARWNPKQAYTVDGIVDAFKLPPIKTFQAPIPHQGSGNDGKAMADECGEEQKASLVKLKSLLAAIDPDCDYRSWTNALMAVFHATGGSDYGLALVDEWSQKGKKYKGVKELEIKWSSFRGKVDRPITVGTLVAMAKAAGADTAAIMRENVEEFEVQATKIVSAGMVHLKPPVVKVNPLEKYSISGDVEKLERELVAQSPLLGDIALMGQATVIYAAYNTGKTLLMLHLIMEAISEGRVVPANLYYVNMDDNGAGLVEKVKLASEYGFQMLVDGYHNFSAKEIQQSMETMIEQGTAKGVVVILDTLKKFVDTMSKTNTSEFTKVIRRFTLKGGTVVALAHTNKNKSPDGKSKYAGTSDVLDDFDCGYVVDKIDRSLDPSEVFVEFENVKRRGSVAATAVYKYNAQQGLSYNEILLSVSKVRDDELAPILRSIEIHSDAPIIAALKATILEGIDSKMKLLKEVAARTGSSGHCVGDVLEKYAGNDPQLHYWQFSKGARGKQTYSLLPGAEPPDAP